MVEPVRGFSSHPIPPESGSNIQQTAKQFQGQIEKFAADLKNVLANPSLSQDPSFLDQIKQHILSLNKTAEQINSR